MTSSPQQLTGANRTRLRSYESARREQLEQAWWWEPEAVDRRQPRSARQAHVEGRRRIGDHDAIERAVKRGRDGKGLKGGRENKPMSRRMALKLFPESDEAFARVMDEQRAEAALIARYGAVLRGAHLHTPSFGSLFA